MNTRSIGILAALAVVCFLAAPAYSAADGNASAGDQNGKAFGANNGQNCGNCQCNGGCQGACACTQGQKHSRNGFGTGACDGTGPKGNGNGNGACDGTGPKRDGCCKAAA